MKSSDNDRSRVRRFGTATATFLVIANMIGIGIFTTTGFLIRDLGSPIAVLLAWLVGGLLALCGALLYAELVVTFPRNGGEYQILSRVYHPMIGFAAGWISLIVGFSAPVAAASIAFGRYAGAMVPCFPPSIAALGLIAFVSVIHAFHVTAGSWIHNLLTAIKIVLILVFIAGGIFWGDPTNIFSGAPRSLNNIIVSPAFAIGLIFVSFAYSGWNGAAYIAGEVKKPWRSLPLSLTLGTVLVILLYLGLNVAFLSAGPPEALSGVVEIGHLTAIRLFGRKVGNGLTVIILMALFTSVSAMFMAGPRVYQVMGEDYKAISFLSYRNKRGGPVVAIILQALLAAVMVITATFEALLTYIGFTLSLFAGLTVAGVGICRYREPDLQRPYRAWGHPVTTIIFVSLSAWMIAHAVWQRPMVALTGFLTIAIGGGMYVLVSRKS